MSGHIKPGGGVGGVQPQDGTQFQTTYNPAAQWLPHDMGPQSPSAKKGGGLRAALPETEFNNAVQPSQMAPRAQPMPLPKTDFNAAVGSPQRLSLMDLLKAR